jgi:L-rhamnose mutarotase
MNKHCFALDLKDDEQAIREYKALHTAVWPEIINSLEAAGIEQLEIYLAGNRLFMIMETNTDFTFEKKEAADAADPKVQEWETLMWKYQQSLPVAKPGEKWVLMEKIFEL